MSQTERKALLAASATAIIALGLLTPATGQAAPTCEVYGFAGPVTIREDYGGSEFLDISFSATGTIAGGPATAKPSKGGNPPTTGTITGGIVENGPGINLTYTEKPNSAGGIPTYNFVGAIRESDMIATGKEGEHPWSTLGPLACLQAKPSGNHMVNLTGDVDIYDKPGGVGNKLPGFAEGGPDSPQVNLIECQKDNWCQIVVPDGRSVWVWGDFVPDRA
jgi:hypothetical protein